MALDIDAFFARLGPVVKVTNDLLTLQGTYRGEGAEADAILDAYEDKRELVQPVLASFDGLAAQMAGQVGQLKAVADRTLGDLQLDLNSPTAQPTDVLPRLYEEMVLAGDTVQASTVGTPTVTAVAGNTGSGVLVASKVDALGRDAETSITELVRFTCASDQYGGGTAGGERFTVVGYPTLPANNYGTRGNGAGGSLTVLNAGGGNKLTGGGFDTFTVANTPDSWTLDAGAAGTNIFSEATNIHGTSGKALKLQGNASTATVTLSQSVLSSAAVGTRYAAGVWLRKGSGTFASGSTLTVRVTDGASYNQVLYSADPSTLTTTYALSSAFYNTGETLPATLKYQITWTTAGGVASTGQIFIDDAAVGVAYEFGGIRYALFRGAVDFTAGDAFTSATTNTGGVFQTYFARFFGFQLPSSGSPTQADALAV